MKHDLPPAGLTTRPELRGNGGAIILFGTIAALYLAREILIPFAFALTLTFLLTPAVALLQRLHAGRVVSVLATVLVSIAVAGGIGGPESACMGRYDRLMSAAAAAAVTEPGAARLA